MLTSIVLAVAAGLLPTCLAQLASTFKYPIGPLTSSSTKWAVKICDVTEYGTPTTDLGPPLLAAFNACKSGGVVSIPSGTYPMSTFVTLSGGSAWAINLEGTIERTGTTASGNMIAIESTTDFEFYSSNGKGAIQGYGYEFLEQGGYGPRLLRLTDVTSFAVHDIALVDSPAFHLVLDTCSQGEVYNMIIRGANQGGLDGIDVWGFQIWIHDVEVTNKDECVTVKSPAQNILVEDIYCNWSGGCAMGSLNAGTNISKIQYSNVYTVNSNQMYMFKSNGGSGFVSDVLLENFIGHKNAYSLYINGYWSSESVQPGEGVLYESIKFSKWTGDCTEGSARAPIYVDCPASAPCTNITLEDIAIWTDEGSEEYYKCVNDIDSHGYCLNSGSTFTPNATVTSTVTAAPSGWSAPYMPSDLSTGFATDSSIPIPTVPNTFFPGATPATARAYKG
ncbi:hypothetical protein LTR36_006955 [Oleoguttula mirabilis]|uniref:Rhamnogalacturonase A n=1 Tax=Oleoguttula mirabilis TaxID=1507867 RepID=A0AAV9JBB8_9PEZI|nr:hypothetical protein LTR36_006955 [Oleoguttula mirabilis]